MQTQPFRVANAATTGALISRQCGYRSHKNFRFPIFQSAVHDSCIIFCCTEPKPVTGNQKCSSNAPPWPGSGDGRLPGLLFAPLIRFWCFMFSENLLLNVRPEFLED